MKRVTLQNSSNGQPAAFNKTEPAKGLNPIFRTGWHKSAAGGSEWTYEPSIKSNDNNHDIIHTTSLTITLVFYRNLVWPLHHADEWILHCGT